MSPGARVGRGALAVAGAAALLLAWRADARADSDVPAEPAAAPASSGDASAHFERGVTFYNEGDFPAALVEFKRAYELAPAWRVLFNIGQSYFQVHDYAQALATLQHFVEEGQNRISDAQRELVDGEIADLGNRVGRVEVISNLPGATVTIDDHVAGVTPLSAPVLVSVGVRNVKATHADRAPAAAEVSVSAGDTVTVRLDFAEPARVAETPPPAAAPPHAAVATPGRNQTPAYIAFGGAAAALVIGGSFGVAALQDKSRLDGECAFKVCAASAQGDIDALSRNATISSVGFGVGIAAAVAGATIWLVTNGAARRGAPVSKAPSATLRWGPGFVAGTF